LLLRIARHIAEQYGGNKPHSHKTKLLLQVRAADVVRFMVLKY